MFLLIEAMVSSYYWTKSLSESSKGKYDSAIFLLKKASKNRVYFDEVYYVYKGFLMAATGDKEAALKNFKQAVDYSNTKKSKLNEDEKVYLLNYASVALSFLDIYEEPFIISNKYNIKNVSKHIMTKFPYED